MITLAQFIVFTTYLVVIYKRFSVLESISHSSYEFVGDKRYWFMAMCWALAFLNLAQGMEGWGVATSAGLLFAGITINWEQRPSYYIHFAGAVTAILSSLIGLYILNDIIAPTILLVFFALITYLFNVKNWLWWIEVQAFLLILIGYTMR